MERKIVTDLREKGASSSEWWSLGYAFDVLSAVRRSSFEDINFHTSRVVRVARIRKGIRNSSDSGLETGGWGVGLGGEKRGAERGSGGRKDGSLFYRCPVILGHKSYSVSRPLSRALQQEAPPRPLRFITMRFAPSFLLTSRSHGTAVRFFRLFLPQFSPTETASHRSAISLTDEEASHK